jgi:hypothetical protein
VYHQNEVEQSAYNFEHANVEALFAWFETCEGRAKSLIEAGLPLPAYEQMLKASHTFNLLDARRAISVTERQRYILRVRDLARAVAEAYYNAREALGFPMLGGKLLIEIGTEELPPKALKGLRDAFAEAVAAGLAEAGIGAVEGSGLRGAAAPGAAVPGRAGASRISPWSAGAGGHRGLRRRRQSHQGGAGFRRLLRRDGGGPGPPGDRQGRLAGAPRTWSRASRPRS